MASSSLFLQEIITERIIASPKKQITFAEYMDLVLYHPQYGYYSSGTVKIGSQGDFFTSSSLGKYFGELLAEQLVEMWTILEYREPFMLVEMGAGQGLLAADILQYLQLNYPKLIDSLEYIIIEQAEGLITQQKNLLQKYLDEKINISWKSWKELPVNSIVGCCFSNELVDAFPIHKIVVEEGEMKEIYVTISNDSFQEVSGKISTIKLREYFQQIGINLSSNHYPNNYSTEINLAALNWLNNIAKRLKRGYLLTIDYGYNAQKYYHPQRYEGTLKCYYQHHHHSNPYINIGCQDITAHVDFTALEIYGDLYGLQKVGFTQQGLFLMALGLGDRLNELSRSNLNLQEVMQRRDALHQLINPTGLGGFGVLVQSKGLSKEERSLKGLREPHF